jgi:hypothetical protein
MILQVLCTLKRNVRVEDYIAVEGINALSLIDDNGTEIASKVSGVLWCGKGSPFPTPPGGPWRTVYRSDHSRFGRCFQVLSDKESEIFIHFADRKSYGCFIVNRGSTGVAFMDKLIAHRDGLQVVQLPPVDERSDADKATNPIDYSTIGRLA